MMKNILLALGCCIICANAMGDDSADSSAASAKAESEVVTVDEIQNTMKDNVIQAENKYLNREICVKGKFCSLDVDYKGMYELELNYMKNGLFTDKLECKFRKDQQREILGNLKKGNVLVVKGVLRGSSVYGLVMEDCSIVKVEARS